MNPEDQHQMIIKKTYPTGAQEWYCPACGRHIILQWPPNYKRIILDEGDPDVTHIGGTSDSTAGLQNIESDQPEDDVPEKPSNSNCQEDPYLLPWLRWIGDRDF